MKEESEVQESVTNEKWLRLLKVYLPYVVLIALSYRDIDREKKIADERKECYGQIVEGLRFWREAFKQSADDYRKMVEQANKQTHAKSNQQ